MMTYNTRSGKDDELVWESKLTKDQQHLVDLSSSTYRGDGNGSIVNLQLALDEMTGREIREAVERLELEKVRLRYMMKQVIDTTNKISGRFGKDVPKPSTPRGMINDDRYFDDEDDDL